MTALLPLSDPPDLDPIAPGAPRAPAPPRGLRLGARIRDTLAAYLPLLLMAMLALLTWWLVKNTPHAAPGRDDAPLRHDPDYTMTAFTLERFDVGGRLKLRIDGDQMRHFPDTDRIEVDGARIHAIAPDGRVTLASARKALANGDASEVQLLGAARVDSVDSDGTTVVMKSEFLQAWLVTERVRSHLPVEVTTSGNTTIRAGGIDYDHGLRKLELQGPTRAVFPPGGRRR